VRSAVSGRSPRPGTPTPAGSWSKPPGISGDHSVRASRSSGAAGGSRPRSSPKPTAAPAVSTPAGTHSKTAATTHDRRGRRRPRARRPLLGTRNHGIATNRQRLGEESAPAQRREERPAVELRAALLQATLDFRERHRSSSRTPVMRLQPAHISRDTDVDNSRCAPPAENNGPQTAGLPALPG
jgi:hypothetical protein